MRIAFVIASLNSGGAERVIANLANCFVSQKDEIELILFNDTIYYDKTTEKTGTSSTTESRKETTTEKTTEDMPIEDDEDDVIYYSSSNVLEKGKSLVKRLTM